MNAIEQAKKVKLPHIGAIHTETRSGKVEMWPDQYRESLERYGRKSVESALAALQSQVSEQPGAEAVAEKIMAELSDRSGVLDDIDDDILDEIRSSIRDIVSASPAASGAAVTVTEREAINHKGAALKALAALAHLANGVEDDGLSNSIKDQIRVIVEEVDALDQARASLAAAPQQEPDAETAAQKIMDDLSDRMGILDGIDAETLADMRSSIRGIIAASHPQVAQPLLDRQRMEQALASPAYTLPQGLNRDETCGFILGVAAQPQTATTWAYDISPPQGFIDYVAKNYKGDVYFSDPEWHALRLWNAAMRNATPVVYAAQPQEAAQAQELPQSDTFVQTVPDMCDRIIWRNRYYHLPVFAESAPAAPEGPNPVILVEAIAEFVEDQWDEPEIAKGIRIEFREIAAAPSSPAGEKQ